ncbi:MAG TPA: hypothetical protein VI653_19915 [Steroidobacteraceae bacterium]
MSLIDSLPRFLFPTRHRGVRWFREQLRELGVTAPLSPACVEEFVMNAAAAADRTRGSDATYAASLRKHLLERARFVHQWTNSDGNMEQPELSEFVAIARKHLLPRSWTIPETGVTVSHRENSFVAPERLIVKNARHSNSPRPLNSAKDLPGAEILTDLKRAGDKS